MDRRVSLEITLRDGIAAHEPGEKVEGEVSWSLAEAPQAVELRLFWRTEGEGNQDLEVVETLAFDKPQARDRRSFECRLPESPWSFRGPLIHLIWGLELLASPGEAAVHEDLVVAPGGMEIALQEARDPAQEKAEQMASGCLALFGKKLPRS